ncbi:geranylgeranylglyceryl/heptaprenylglyceryl phosphate synthase [Pontimicrobium sp. IMCC45349]|uniref:geranylgeranylglyceryl/heptaprenylglyceryl phosphate synthase n=1 Tax=Pontimicrobium sp. IMCC45349 TaxID=3391574 RepID=UPI0039A387AF
MNTVYQHIKTSNQKLLAVLMDPDKMNLEAIAGFIEKVNTTVTTHIFVGGSTVDEGVVTPFVEEIKRYTKLPVILFPGDTTQLTENADALLFLSLISGRNPEYLIEKQVQSVSRLRAMSLEVIPTGYILIENGKETAVQRVSKTQPMERIDISKIVDTAKAGELLGMQLVYLEAGSGALHPVNKEIITAVKRDLNIPLIVGGGIRNKIQLMEAYNAGADLVVIGTAFENDETFFNELINL